MWLTTSSGPYHLPSCQTEFELLPWSRPGIVQNVDVKVGYVLQRQTTGDLRKIGLEEHDSGWIQHRRPHCHFCHGMSLNSRISACSGLVAKLNAL